MAPQDPSIQSFFTPQSSSSPTKPASSFCKRPGDGFTAEEIDAALRPAPSDSWDPPTEYEDCDIASLYAGPKCVTFMGRIVNFFDMSSPSKAPKAAKGCVKMIVKDNTCAITVCT